MFMFVIWNATLFPTLRRPNSFHISDKTPNAFSCQMSLFNGFRSLKKLLLFFNNYLDKNLIKLFLTSCCKGGVSNSQQLPELAFVRFSFSRAWKLQSFKSLCERSPPMEQHKKCYTEVALPVPYAEEQPCCVHNSSDQSPHEYKI